MIPPETYLWPQTVIGSSSTVRTSSGSGACKLRRHRTRLLDVAGRPRLRPADVGDEVRHLCGRGCVWGYGEHGVLARDGAEYFQAFHPVEDAGDCPSSPVAGVDDDLVLCWHEADDEAGEDLDPCGARVMWQCQVAVPDLEDTQLGEVAAHGRLRDLDTLVCERNDDILLGAEVALRDQTQYQILPRRFVHRRHRRSQNSPPTRGARARG